MKLPCKENKCIKLPACKSKEEIACTLLWYYHDKINETSISTGEVWDAINEDFPNLITIDKD